MYATEPHKFELIPQVEASAIQEDVVENQCDLTFWSNKELNGVQGYWETPPDEFIKQIKNYNCNDQNWLVRLAHYESQYDKNAINGQYKGLFQIGDSARDMCINNERNKDDFDCALYLKDWLPEMPLMFESHFKNKNSFEDLAYDNV